jgi:leucyl aminopeptidase (aminopeptidase T)
VICMTARDGSAPAPLQAVADRVVGDYLGLRPDEAFLLVTDDGAVPEVAAAIVRSAETIGADPTHAMIRRRRASGDEPPEPVAAAMAASDVCLCIAARSIYHTNAKLRAQEAGTRGCFNAPPRLDSWTLGAMSADFFAIRRTAERLAHLLRAARHVRVKSPAGSDITVCVEGREPKGWYTGIVREPGEITAYPGGEVSFPPVEGLSNGRIVFEHVVTDLGRIEEPITLDVVDGNVTAINGGPDAARLRDLIDGVPNATNLAELGIGLNPAARVTDEITETKKRLGTVHFAIGDNASGYGGVVECWLHLDGMLFEPTVWIDDQAVVRDGELLL